MPPPSTIYLISGANRGLGLALVKNILATRAEGFVYAGCRNPKNATDLQQLQEEHPERIAVIELVSADVDSNATAVKAIEERHGRVDTVIANAAIATGFATVAEVVPAALDEHCHINLTGMIVLFQAVYALLKKSSLPRFIAISSAAARIGGPSVEAPFGSVAYSASKAAMNWATRKIHFENEWIVAFPLYPGPMDTDGLKHTMAHDVNGAFKRYGNIVIPSPDTAAAKILNVVDSSTREKEGGALVDTNGAHLGW